MEKKHEEEIALTVTECKLLASSMLNKFEKHCGEIKKKRNELEDTLKTLEDQNKQLWKKKEELSNKLLTIDQRKKELIPFNESLAKEEDNLKENIADFNNQLPQMMVKKRMLEQEQNDKKETAKKEFEALIQAMAYFKQHLKCYIDLENEDNYLYSFHFFSKLNKKKSMSNSKYYVRLNYSDKVWKVVELKPSLPCEREISCHLEETGDIQGFMAHVYDLFCAIREKEKK